MAFHDSERSPTTVAEPETTVFEQSGPSASAGKDLERAGRKKAGIRDVVSGLVLIGIGLAYGGSVFMGTANALDWIFDVLGTAWVLKGAYQLVT